MLEPAAPRASFRRPLRRRRRHPIASFATATVAGLATLAGIGALAPSVRAQTPGPTNALTDVPGIKVGHDERVGDGYRSGTTVILTELGATASVDVQGGAPGTRETDLLEPGGLVTQAHAIVLSGGSAYGLATADGVMQWLEERGHGFPIQGGVVPIVPTAILFDLGRGGDFSKRPDAGFGYRAADAATAGPVEQGRRGAGAGARYGLGSASVVLPNGYTVAAIVGLNPAGSPINPVTCLPYGVFLELEGEFGLVEPNAAECRDNGNNGDDVGNGGDAGEGPAFNTTIALVATDAPLDQTQAQRMAKVANSGLARSIRPIHNLGDGDAVFGVATSPPDAELGLQELQAIYNAAADALGRAVVHALIQGGVYCERYPSACRGAR